MIIIIRYECYKCVHQTSNKCVHIWVLFTKNVHVHSKKSMWNVSTGTCYILNAGYWTKTFFFFILFLGKILLIYRNLNKL